MAFLVSILSLSLEFSTLLLFVLVAPQYIDGSSLEVPTSDTHPTPHTLSPHLELEILSELKSTPGVRINNECLGGAGDSAKVDGFKSAGFAVEGNGAEAKVKFWNTVNLGASISQAPRLPCLHEAAEESLQEGGRSRLELT
ncbi:hypothetical protein C8J55DRAFT_555123 [Lentinula edodes]|uniref:Uncharacterized protein n=1 Tax=Lentinula lateritia TaxID=40482 RepID=A0A9W9E0N4_9AGAR|nr:hypothetical protein C8J55DRAFT_555123 [Lentinula edodes]